MQEYLPEVIGRYIDAYNARNVEAMLACLTADISFTSITAGDVTASTSGLAEFRLLAEEAVECFSSRHQSILSVTSVHGVTLVEIAYFATVARDLPNGWKAGQTISLKGSSVFELTGKRISRLIDQSSGIELERNTAVMVQDNILGADTGGDRLELG